MFNRLYAFVDLSVRYASVGSGVEAFPVLSESAACRRLDGSIGSRVRGDFGESVGEGRVEDTKDVDVDITMSENVKAYDQSPKMGEKYTKPKQSRVRAREDDSDEERQEVEAEIDGKNTRRHHKRRRLAPPARKQKKATTSQNNVSAFVVATPVTISAIPTTNNTTTGGEQKKKKVQFDDELCRYSSFKSGDAPTDISVRASTSKTYSSCDDIGRAEIRREGQAKANHTVSDNKRRRIETPPSTSHGPPRSLLKVRTSKPETVPLLITTPTSSFRPVPDNFPPPILIDASVPIIESYNGFSIPVVQVYEPEEWDVWSPMVRPRRRSNVLCAPLLDNRLRMVEAFEMVYRWGLHDPSIAGASTDWVKVKLRKAKKAAMLVRFPFFLQLTSLTAP
ncbi:hypothetical protein OF83DRAFT_634862 [Amylostereum chailletii]|nr:hypothetical protein OF83DRAFT_634862 [Amylostereum chailletii]